MLMNDLRSIAYPAGITRRGKRYSVVDKGPKRGPISSGSKVYLLKRQRLGPTNHHGPLNRVLISCLIELPVKYIEQDQHRRLTTRPLALETIWA